MYNGIGLQTARGSATNGYVQANLSSVLLSRKRVEYNAEDDLRRMEAEVNRKPNEELLQHARKRAIEMRCAEFEMLMDEKGFDEEETAKKVNDYRKLLLSQLESGELNLDDELDIKNSHAKMQYAKKGRDRFRDALGLSKDYVAGSSMEKMNKTDVVDAALTPAPPVDEKASMLSTLKEMKKKQKEKKKAKKESKKKRRKASTSSSSSSSDSDSDSSESSSDSSDDDKKRKKAKKVSKKLSEKVKKEVSDDDVPKATTKSNAHEKRRSPEVRRNRDDERRDRSSDRRDKAYSSRRQDGGQEHRRPHAGRERNRSRSPRRRHNKSNSPDEPRKEIKQEPMSDGEQSSPHRKRRSESYSSDDSHKHRKVRSMVSKK